MWEGQANLLVRRGRFYYAPDTNRDNFQENGALKFYKKWHLTPAPTTLPVIWVVLLHTEAFTERILGGFVLGIQAKMGLCTVL